jgi:hypothetical protein
MLLFELLFFNTKKNVQTMENNLILLLNSFQWVNLKTFKILIQKKKYTDRGKQFDIVIKLVPIGQS